MTNHKLSRLALAGLAPLFVGALAAAPLAAQDEAAKVPGNRYVLVNQTGGALACRYRVNLGGMGGVEQTRWQDADPIAAGAEFSRTARSEGESLSLNCNAEGGNPFTVRPGARYAVTKADNGRVVVTRMRA